MVVPNLDRQKMADLLRKMASNKKMQKNEPTLNWILQFSFWHSHRALMMNQIMQNSVCQQLERNFKSLVRVRAGEMGYASFARWFIGVDKRQSLKWSISVSADRIFTDDIFSSMNVLWVRWCCWKSHRLFPQVSQSLPGCGVAGQRSCESAGTWRRWLELVLLCTHSHGYWPG